MSTSIDGCVRVWDMRDASDSPCVKESRNVLPLAEVDSMDRLSIAWSPDGTKFAVPGRKGITEQLRSISDAAEWVRFSQMSS